MVSAVSSPPRRRGSGRAGGSGLGGGAWHGREAPARSKRGPGWLSTTPAAVLCTAAARNRAGELKEGEKDPNTVSEISRDHTVKQR